jgi:hypothetical protein
MIETQIDLSVKMEACQKLLKSKLVIKILVIVCFSQSCINYKTIDIPKQMTMYFLTDNNGFHFLELFSMHAVLTTRSIRALPDKLLDQISC